MLCTYQLRLPGFIPPGWCPVAAIAHSRTSVIASSSIAVGIHFAATGPVSNIMGCPYIRTYMPEGCPP